jgi:hypothetical protein
VLVHERFLVDRLALGQVFLRVLRFFSVSIFPALPDIQSRSIWGIGRGRAPWSVSSADAGAAITRFCDLRRYTGNFSCLKVPPF